MKLTQQTKPMQTMMEHEKPNNQNSISYDKISLDVVTYNRTFTRNRGTLSQIVKSLMDMKDRLSEPINQYQKGLYPQIQKECESTVQKYNELLQKVQISDYPIFGFYLNGPRNDGKRKPTNTSHELKSYGVSEFKETIKSMNDRMRHIKNDCMKKFHDVENPETETSDIPTSVFTRMINFCDQYHCVLVDRLNEWDTFIVQFRETNGVTKETKLNEMAQKQRTRPVIKSVKPVKIVKSSLFLPRNKKNTSQSTTNIQ